MLPHRARGKPYYGFRSWLEVIASYWPTILEYCFGLFSVAEITLEFDLNNCGFGINFQQGNRFGRNVYIMIGFGRHKLAGISTAKRMDQLLLRESEHTCNYSIISIDQLIHVLMHSSENNSSISLSC